MTLNQLRALLAIEEHGSVQAAAGALGCSRTTTSQLINNLERHSGRKLLIRTPQGTRLTAVGEDIAEEARQLLALAASLERRMVERVGAPAPLRIQLTTGMPKMAHALAIQVIRQHLPQTALEVETFREPDAPYAEDVHLRLQFGPPPTDGPFRTFLLGAAPVRLIATADYLARHGTPQSVDDLAGHSLLLWRAAAGTGAQLPRTDGGWIPVSPTISTHAAPLLRTLASQGIGIALAPCPPEGFAPPWEVFETLLPEHIGSQAALRAIIPERLAGLTTTRRLIEVTRELSVQYSANKLTWRQER